jgi:parallel beta-helix repeat protein
MKYNIEDGISADYVNGCTIFNNTFTSNTQQGLYVYRNCDYWNVTHNTFTSNADGIYLSDNIDHWNVSYNKLISNTNGIYEKNENCPANSANTHQKNNFTSNTYGLNIRVTNNATVKENTFTDNSYGLYFEHDFADNNTQHDI